MPVKYTYVPQGRLHEGHPWVPVIILMQTPSGGPDQVFQLERSFVRGQHFVERVLNCQHAGPAYYASTGGHKGPARADRYHGMFPDAAVGRRP